MALEINGGREVAGVIDLAEEIVIRERVDEALVTEFRSRFMEVLAMVGDNERLVDQILTAETRVHEKLVGLCKEVLRRGNMILDEKAVLPIHHISLKDVVSTDMREALFVDLEKGEEPEIVVLDANDRYVYSLNGEEVVLVPNKDRVLQELGTGRGSEEHDTSVKPITILGAKSLNPGTRVYIYNLYIEEDLLQGLNSRFEVEKEGLRAGRRTINIDGEEIEIVADAYESWRNFGITKERFQEVLKSLTPIEGIWHKANNRGNMSVYRLRDVLLAVRDFPTRRIELNDGEGYFYDKESNEYKFVIGYRFIEKYLGLEDRKQAEALLDRYEVKALDGRASVGSGSKKSRRLYLRKDLDKILALKVDEIEALFEEE